MQTENIDTDAPEWAARFLSIPEFARIVGENPSTIYRKIDAGTGIRQLGQALSATI